MLVYKCHDFLATHSMCDSSYRLNFDEARRAKSINTARKSMLKLVIKLQSLAAKCCNMGICPFIGNVQLAPIPMVIGVFVYREGFSSGMITDNGP